MASLDLRRIGGALALYWAGGDGPSRAQIQSALLVAGYEGADRGNKQQMVQRAITEADEETARAVIEELLSLLRESDYFRRSEDSGLGERLRRAATQGGHGIDEAGYVLWALRISDQSDNPAPTDAADAAVARSHTAPDTAAVATIREVVSPDLDLLLSSLRRLGSGAARPIIARRRQERPSISVEDEYDVQDLIELLLKLLYSDVRTEEPTPSSAGSSSRIDLHLREGATAVEAKVSGRRHGEREIKREILVDINDYRSHPTVNTLVIAIYDLADKFKNPAGFEHDLSGDHNGLQVRTLVVPWVGPRRSP